VVLITDQPSLRGASARFGVLELREPHLQNLPHRHPAVVVFFHENELLRIGQTGRNHHLSTSFQLVDQRWGNEVRSRCHDHLIERGVLGPAMIAVGNLELNVGAALPIESLLRLPPELFDDFDAVHFPSQLREDCGLITETGAVQH
jgi:hypothetical protein